VTPPRAATVDLYWIPLGAGGHSVRFNGRVFEAVQAARDHRRRCDLYHAALVVEHDGDRHTIELAPSPNADEASRGVVATGAVGNRHAGRLRLFRYEVRCWRGGTIPDLGEAVGGPRRLSSDPQLARRLLGLVPRAPTPVWGRDELKAGEMWNSNSLISWLIATAGLSSDLARPPLHSRAPGWDAGLEVARRSRARGLRAPATPEGEVGERSDEVDERDGDPHRLASVDLRAWAPPQVRQGGAEKADLDHPRRDDRSTLPG
jgi:hypothetical protein